LLGTFQAWWDGRKERQLAADADSAAAEDGVIEPHPAE
jgi:urea transport system permease protein